MGQQLRQIVVSTQGPMRIVVAAWRLAETLIEISDEGGRIGIGCFPRADPAQAQLLDEPVLQSQVGTLHPSLGLARVRTERIDVQFVQGPAELRYAFAGRARP